MTDAHFPAKPAFVGKKKRGNKHPPQGDRIHFGELALTNAKSEEKTLQRINRRTGSGVRGRGNKVIYYLVQFTFA